MKPLLTILVLLFHFPASIAMQGDIVDDLNAQFKAANSKDIASVFSSSVDLIIIDEEDVYSKAQAEQILRSFFNKYPPVKATVIHRINTNPNFRFGALSLVTKNGAFRVSITLKKAGSAFNITELKIEAEK
ncbi:MAG: DUF4783 domain-containing protein [Pedobacter sp.]|nr:MAG: DUF4783 domain-containing protein [Pedobacter sp.]